MLKKLMALMSLVLVIITLGCGKADNQEIKLGAILPLTGDAAPYGSALKKGMDLAVAEINAVGGIRGKKLTIVFEDDRNLPQDGVTAYNKLVSVDKVPMVIGAMFSSVTLAIAPIAERNKVVLLSPTSSDVLLTNAGDYIFRIYPSDSYDGEFLANFAFDKLGARKAAIVSMQASSTTSISQLFKKLFESKGGAVISGNTFNEGATDYRAILTKIKQQQQDIVFLPAALKESTLFLRQAKELSVKPKILGISTLYDPKLIELAGEAAEGVLFSSPIFDPNSQSPEIVTFVEAYKSKHKAAPDILGAYGYDTVNVAVESLKFASSGQITSQSIKSGLYEIKAYKGVTGEMSFDSNGDVTKELKIMTVKGAKFTPFLL